MKIHLYQSYSFHQQGQRDYQEDSRLPDTDVPKTSQRFFLVCDGVGGCEKGEVASRTVCEAIENALCGFDFENDLTNVDLNHILDKAYDALDDAVNDDNQDMATTMTFIAFHGGGCTMAHIGDSRIYQIRPSDGILYRSDDHSMVNSMVHNGMLTPDEAINHPQSNVITRYMEPVGNDQNRSMATVMRTKDIQADDYFFLCTDGVLHCVSDDELLNILASDTDDNAKMQSIAQMSQNSEDNNTAYLIHVKDVETDPVTASQTEMYDDDSHATKKIKMASQSLEEIESVQIVSHSNIWNWIKRFIKM